MTLDICELNRMVLEAVSEDFEPFESLVLRLSDRQACSGGEPGIDRIENTLSASIADGYVGAYLIHADPPYVTAVEVNFDNIRRYWFLITEKGENLLQELLEEEVGSLDTSRDMSSAHTQIRFRIPESARRQPANRH